MLESHIGSGKFGGFKSVTAARMPADTSDKTMPVAKVCVVVCGRPCVCACTCVSVAGWGLITEGGGGAEEAHFSNMVIR